MMPATIDHVCFPQPAPDSYVWKYYDLPYFIDLLLKREINLARSDLFEDPYESTLPKALYDGIKSDNFFDLIPEEHRDKMKASLDRVQARNRKANFVSCWYLNNNESVAMWKLYAKTKNSVAIKCRYDTLVQQLPQNCFIGRVNYIDYETTAFPMNNLYYPVMHKRLEYSYESEVRIVSTDVETIIHDDHVPPKNIKIGVDMNILLDSVFVSPGCSSFFPDVVNDILEKFVISKTVIKSKLFDPPAHRFLE